MCDYPVSCNKVTEFSSRRNLCSVKNAFSSITNNKLRSSEIYGNDSLATQKVVQKMKSKFCVSNNSLWCSVRLA